MAHSGGSKRTHKQVASQESLGGGEEDEAGLARLGCNRGTLGASAGQDGGHCRSISPGTMPITCLPQGHLPPSPASAYFTPPVLVASGALAKGTVLSTTDSSTKEGESTGRVG
jgi:hypothetical protein